MPLPLTRTAALRDFPDCHSVARWQQQWAIEAYTRWLQVTPAIALVGVCCWNWGAAAFRAPGPDPIYRSFGDTQPEPEPLAAIFALSVLDRIEEPRVFLRRQAQRLVPDGLIVCTFAAWDAYGPDCAVGHELRHRIYDCDAWRKLLKTIPEIGLRPFGGVDLRYRGHTLGDHTLATLVAVRRD